MKLESYKNKNDDVIIGDILIARANKLLSDKCENMLVQQNVSIGSDKHLKILHILLSITLNVMELLNNIVEK